MSPARVANVPAVEVLRVHPEGGIGLQVDPLGSPLVEEVVHVGDAPGRGQRLVHLGQRDAQRHGLLLVHVHVELGRVLQSRGPDLGEARVLAGQVEELVAGREQRVVAEASPVLELQLEAGGVAQLGDRRRREDEDVRLLDPGEGLLGAGRHACRREGALPGARPRA